MFQEASAFLPAAMRSTRPTATASSAVYQVSASIAARTSSTAMPLFFAYWAARVPSIFDSKVAVAVRSLALPIAQVQALWIMKKPPSEISTSSAAVAMTVAALAA